MFLNILHRSKFVILELARKKYKYSYGISKYCKRIMIINDYRKVNIYIHNYSSIYFISSRDHTKLVYFRLTPFVIAQSWSIAQLIPYLDAVKEMSN